MLFFKESPYSYAKSHGSPGVPLQSLCSVSNAEKPAARDAAVPRREAGGHMSLPVIGNGGAHGCRSQSGPVCFSCTPYFVVHDLALLVDSDVRR